MEQSKSANQLYQESGSTLSFKDWLEKEKKDQKTFIVNKPLNDIIENAKIQFSTAKEKVKSEKILGLNKNVILISLSIVALAVIVKITKKN